MALPIFALLPVFAYTAWHRGPALQLFKLCMALAAGLLVQQLATLATRPERRSPALPWLLDIGKTALLLCLLLPTTFPWWAAAAGMVAAIGLAQAVYGGFAQNLFHPAMLGLAMALVGFPEATATDDVGGMAALLVMLGGIALITLSVQAWQAPLAMLVAASVGALIVDAATDVDPVGASVAGLLSSLPVLLGALFVLTDPVTSALSAPGRIIAGFGAGVLLVACGSPGQDLRGLPFAILTINCITPWLDRHTRPAPKRLADTA